jgi:hypothetical protein
VKKILGVGVKNCIENFETNTKDLQVVIQKKPTEDMTYEGKGQSVHWVLSLVHQVNSALSHL